MARIRNIGELTFSRFHALPYRAESPCVFELAFDAGARKTTTVGEYFRCSYGMEANLPGLQHSYTRWEELFMAGLDLADRCELVCSKGAIDLWYDDRYFGESLNHHLAQPDDFPTLVDAAIELGDRCPIKLVGSVVLLSILPLYFYQGLFNPPYPAIKVSTLESGWDFKLGEDLSTVLIHTFPKVDVENTDRLLRAFARKLNESQRKTAVLAITAQS
ncbi:MAG: hypothetical protein Q8Q05_03070 [bacterium]|nr:hypothetical protein [bacterium]